MWFLVDYYCLQKSHAGLITLERINEHTSSIALSRFGFLKGRQFFSSKENAGKLLKAK
jgi:hypothetical protein